MARARTWKLHLNLDEFNAAYSALCDTDERADFVAGLCRGMNQGKRVDQSTEAFQSGFAIGEEMRQEAEGYRESRRVIGSLGGNPNLKPKPNQEDNHMVNLDEPSGYHDVNAIHNPQSLIFNLQSTNDNPQTPPLPPPVEGKRSRRSRKQIIEGFPPEVRVLVNTLLDEWPSCDPADGRKIVCSAEDFGQRVAEILETNANITPDTLLHAARSYLHSGRTRFKAPQFFFGPGWKNEAPPWIAYVRASLKEIPA